MGKISSKLKIFFGTEIALPVNHKQHRITLIISKITQQKFRKPKNAQEFKMRFLRIPLFLAFIVLACQGLWAQTTVTGNIETTIVDIVDHIPGIGTNKFVIPTTAQMSVFQSVFSQMNAGNFSDIQTLLAPFDYTISRFLNTPTSDTLYLVKENYPIKLGWGTFIYNPKTSNDLAIEAPHPLWDRYTWSMAIKVFLGTKAKWFMMAGTHRYANSDSSSDMAHVTASMFYTAHKTDANAIAVQIHGFDGSSPQYAGYPNAVISNGTLYPSALYYTLRDNYVQQGFTTGVFSYSTYNSLNQLGATTNKEGLWSNSNNKKFVHIEHDQPLRFDTTKLRKTANAIIKTFSQPTEIAKEPSQSKSYNLIEAFPNPFNPGTTISVSIMTGDLVTLSIRDILGRTIQTIHEGYLAAGKHTFRFDASSLPSGIYFGTLTGSNSLQRIKLILLK